MRKLSKPLNLENEIFNNSTTQRTICSEREELTYEEQQTMKHIFPHLSFLLRRSIHRSFAQSKLVMECRLTYLSSFRSFVRSFLDGIHFWSWMSSIRFKVDFWSLVSPTVLAIWDVTVLVTYYLSKVAFFFRAWMNHPKSTATPLAVWLISRTHQRFPKRCYTFL